MVANRLQATIAGTLGYQSSMSEPERRKVFKKASALITEVVKGKKEPEYTDLILTTMDAVRGFDGMKNQLEKEMLELAEDLSVAEWIDEEPQRGFGLQMLSIVIGETGDLSNYENPAKVWKRLGCAPYTKDGVTLMGSTWRRRNAKRGEVRLEKEDWEKFGYSPRRRSIAYLIGENMVKQNGQKKDGNWTFKGPYRLRYEEGKLVFAERHPDYTKLRIHNHGMLVSAKLLLKNLWLEWWGLT